MVANRARVQLNRENEYLFPCPRSRLRTWSRTYIHTYIHTYKIAEHASRSKIVRREPGRDGKVLSDSQDFNDEVGPSAILLISEMNCNRVPGTYVCMVITSSRVWINGYGCQSCSRPTEQGK